MKRICLSSLLLASTLSAGVNIHTGWNLLGATEDTNPGTIHCAKTIWSYDQEHGWSLYQNIDTTQNFNFPQLSSISKGQGFWVNSTCDSNISDTSMSDINITQVPSTTFTWTDLIDEPLILGLEENSDDMQYSVWNLNSDKFTVTDKAHEGDSWQEDDTHSGNFTKHESNVSIESTNGFAADIIIKDTHQITSINGTQYNDLFATDIEIVVTAPEEWADTWDWAPTYWDGNESVPVTTNEEFKNMLLTNNNWFDSDYYAMLDGNISDISGNIVKGVQDGVQENCTSKSENDCKKIVRTTEVIGTWTFDNTKGIALNLPQELQTLSMVFDDSSPTGYYVQSSGTDKVGSIWKETLYTGSDATETLIQNIVTQ